MANDKKPSIYSDRGSIGSAEELDEYGVWVKSEPQVLSVNGKSSDLEDLAMPVDDSTDADDSLSFDDAVLDLGGSSGASDSGIIEFPEDDIDIDINDDPLSNPADLADFNMPMDDDLGIINDDDDGSGLDIEDTSFDEFEVPSSSGEEISLDDDLTSDNFTDEDFNEDFNSEDLDSDLDIDGLDTEDFGVPTVKAIENSIDSIQEDFDAVQNGEGELSSHLLKKIADELSSIRCELTDLKKEFANVRSGGPEGDKDDRSGFFSEEDDETIALTGDELDNILGEDSGLGEEQAEDTQKSGFDIGDDDEDEAIALTGDELDNILNSADFTEESGTEESPENEFSIDDDSLGEDADMDPMDIDIDLSPDAAEEDSFDISAEGDDSDDSSMDLPPLADLDDDAFADFTSSHEDNPDDDVSAEDELEKLREEGAEPVTPAPDDTSYLEDSEPSDETLDFSDAVIDEPDLSLDDIATNDDLTEPSLDETDFDLDSLDDLTIDSGSDDLALDDADDFAMDSSDDMALDDSDDLALDDSDDSVIDSGDDLALDDSDDSVIDSMDDLALDSLDDLAADSSDDTALDSVDDLAADAGDEGGLEDIDVGMDDDWADQPAIDPNWKPAMQAAQEAPTPPPAYAPQQQAAPQAGFAAPQSYAPPPPAQSYAPPAQAAPAQPAPAQPAPQAAAPAPAGLGDPKKGFELPSDLRSELRNILSYMDQLLESLPESKIEEFAKSEYFDSYKKLFKDLGLV